MPGGMQFDLNPLSRNYNSSLKKNNVSSIAKCNTWGSYATLSVYAKNL
jgi:hypothetical protein